VSFLGFGVQKCDVTKFLRLSVYKLCAKGAFATHPTISAMRSVVLPISRQLSSSSSVLNGRKPSSSSPVAGVGSVNEEKTLKSGTCVGFLRFFFLIVLFTAPYEWKQTPNEVLVTVPCPGAANKRSITITLGQAFLGTFQG
jgi:hypothetical protein